jgi:hypothetical protein
MFLKKYLEINLKKYFLYITIMESVIENIENVVIVEIKKKRGRPLKGMEKPKVENPEPKKHGRPTTAWRHRADGSYNSSAIDPEYAKKNIGEHIIEILTLVGIVRLL